MLEKKDDINENTLGKALKHRIKDWMLDTDIHGLPNIARSDRLAVQIIWAICFCLSSGVCAFLVGRSIESYLDFEVFSKYDMIYETPMVFPTVSICNMNPFVTNASVTFVKGIMEANNLTIEEITSYKNFFETSSEGLLLYENIINYKYLALTNAKNPDVPDETKKTFGLSFNDMVVVCLFNSLECTESDFVWYYDFQYGNCYRFNSGFNSDGDQVPLKQTSRAGNMDGLVMQLFVGLGFPESPYTFSMSSGAHIFIHNNTIEPTTLEGYDIAAGTSTNFVLNKKFVDKMPLPYNDCYDDLNSLDAYDSILYQAIINAKQTYRQSDCFRLCYQKQLIETCGCYDTMFTRLFNARACVSYGDLTCGSAVYYAFSLSTDCLKLCPLECDNWEVSATVNFGKFPTETYARYLPDLPHMKSRFGNVTANYSMIKSSLLQLNVNYYNTAYELIEQHESLSMIDLIAAIGGTLGLFLGMSFLSFIELVEVTLEITLISYEHYTRAKKKKVSQLPEIEVKHVLNTDV